MKTFASHLAIGLICLAITAGSLPGQSTNRHPTEKTAAKQAPAKKPSAGPFNGKLAAVDQSAKTITVGKRTFQITSETKINKAGKPATLAEGVVGEPASGYVKPTEDGKWIATTVNFGPKPDAKAPKPADRK